MKPRVHRTSPRMRRRYTCESAEYFRLYYVQARIEKFQQQIEADPGSNAAVQEHFPFHKYFSTAPQPLFRGRDAGEDLEVACEMSGLRGWEGVSVPERGWADMTFTVAAVRAHL